MKSTARLIYELHESFRLLRNQAERKAVKISRTINNTLYTYDDNSQLSINKSLGLASYKEMSQKR